MKFLRISRIEFLILGLIICEGWLSKNVEIFIIFWMLVDVLMIGESIIMVLIVEFKRFLLILCWLWRRLLIFLRMRLIFGFKSLVFMSLLNFDFCVDVWVRLIRVLIILSVYILILVLVFFILSVFMILGIMCLLMVKNMVVLGRVV